MMKSFLLTLMADLMAVTAAKIEPILLTADTMIDVRNGEKIDRLAIRPFFFRTEHE
ncbi:MAG: hypothetical protein AAGA69_12110 [Pseudomonadota bacterium]